MSTLIDPEPMSPAEPGESQAEGRSLHDRIMVWIVILVIAGCCWLISGQQGAEAGHVPWRAGSVLRTVTTLMALNFEYPTRSGAEVKWLIQGLGAAAAMLVAAAAWYVRRRPRGSEEDAEGSSAHQPALQSDTVPGHRSVLPAWEIAQFALLALTGWMAMSALWSPWSEASLGEAVRQFIFTVWAIALGRTLLARGVRQASVGLVAVLALTAAVGIWYYFERNPAQRLKFPIGNPIFMASCLIPGVVVMFGLALGAAPERLRRGASVSSGSGSWRWLTWPGGVVGLIVLLWALKLTDSRGPFVGLGIGLFAGLLMAVCLRLRGRVRRGALLAIGFGLIVGLLYVQIRGTPDFISRRSTTVSFRQYAWTYAVRLFADRPTLGQGQAGYFLLSEQFAAADAQADPGVFSDALVGHAHNEWLEILADLGLVGFCLIAVVLGATLWSAVVAVREAPGGRDRGLAIGLGAAFVALVVAEASGPALRRPGLPVVFYTVVGLIWAQARAARPPRPWIGRMGRGLSWSGLAAGLLVSWFLAVAAERDWKGALAEKSVGTALSNQRWDEAMILAAQSGKWRLSVEDRVVAAHDYNLAAYQAARYYWEQMGRMLQRLGPSRTPPSNIVELAKEDAAAFAFYADQCFGSGQLLLSRMPAYPGVAGRMADTLLCWQGVELAEQRLGLKKEARSFMEPARQWAILEFQRDPTDARLAMMLLQISVNQPVGHRIDILRAVFRGGPRPVEPEPPGASLFDRRLVLDPISEFEPVLMHLGQGPEFATTIDKLLEQARAAVGQPISDWPDPYVPETFRLAGRDRMLKKLFPEAVELAEMAARASERIADRFPDAPAFALVDRARYLLFAFPDDPGRAVVSCQEAIERWPTGSDRRTGLALKRSLAYYLLAAGDESAARAQLASLGESLTAEQMDRVIGVGLGDLCQTLAAVFGSGTLPEWFAARLARSIELVPDWPTTRWLAASLAFSTRDSQGGVDQLKAFEKTLNDPEQAGTALQAMKARFPQDSLLNEYVESRLTTLPAPGSMPAEPRPARVPQPEILTPAVAPEFSRPGAPDRSLPSPSQPESFSTLPADSPPMPPEAP